MSQADIIQVLEKERTVLSISEIADRLNIPTRFASMTVKQLLKYGEINYIEIDRRVALRFFKTKRRMKLYYL